MDIRSIVLLVDYSKNRLIFFFFFLFIFNIMTGGPRQKWEKPGDNGEIPIQARIRGKYELFFKPKWHLCLYCMSPNSDENTL